MRRSPLSQALTNPAAAALDDGQYRLYTRLACLAADADPRGIVAQAPGRPYTVPALARVLGTEEETLRAALDELAAARLVIATEDGLVMPELLRRRDSPSDQPEAVRERVRTHREKTRTARRVTTCNEAPVTSGNDPRNEAAEAVTSGNEGCNDPRNEAGRHVTTCNDPCNDPGNASQKDVTSSNEAAKGVTTCNDLVTPPSGPSSPVPLSPPKPPGETNTVPPNGGPPDKPATGPPFTADEHALVNAMHNHLAARSALPATAKQRERWRMSGLHMARHMLDPSGGHPLAEWLACLEWAGARTYLADKLISLSRLSAMWSEYQLVRFGEKRGPVRQRGTGYVPDFPTEHKTDAYYEQFVHRLGTRRPDQDPPEGGTEA